MSALSENTPENTLAPKRPRRSKRATTQTVQAHAEEQAGVVGYHQLAKAGLSSRSIKRRVVNGELTPRSRPRPRRDSDGEWVTPPGPTDALGVYMAEGAYSLHRGPLHVDGKRWAAIHGAPAGALVSHLSAAAVHNLERPRGAAIHILAVSQGWRGPQGVIAHRTSSLPESDQTTVNGVPVTSMARTLIDAAAIVDEARLDDLVDEAIAVKIYDEVALQQVIKDRPSIGAAERLAQALGRVDDKSGEFLSNFERRLTRLIETSTLIPPPVVNVLLHGFRPDIRFPGTRAIVECDGRDYHRSLAQIAADERREEILRAAGFVFRRVRWSQLRYEPERTLTAIERFVLANLDAPVPGLILP